MEGNETGKNQSQAEFSIQTKRDEIRENEKVIGPNYDVSDLNAAYKNVSSNNILKESQTFSKKSKKSKKYRHYTLV